MTDPAEYNRQAWNRQVEKGNKWTIPVSSEAIAAAREGRWHILLTPCRPVPAAWFPPLAGLRVLCLAGSGGQQAPILAATGAIVTVLDNSPGQLQQDEWVARREGLKLTTVLGDMRALNAFQNDSFDLIVHPCSNCFVPEVCQVWREAARVLRPAGTLLAGFVNPAAYIFDEAASNRGELVVRHALPYSDPSSLTAQELQAFVDAGEPFVFSHSLEDLLAGQIRAGLVLEDLLEDTCPDKPISNYMPTFLATRSRKK